MGPRLGLSKKCTGDAAFTGPGITLCGWTTRKGEAQSSQWQPGAAEELSLQGKLLKIHRKPGRQWPQGLGIQRTPFHHGQCDSQGDKHGFPAFREWLSKSLSLSIESTHMHTVHGHTGIQHRSVSPWTSRLRPSPTRQALFPSCLLLALSALNLLGLFKLLFANYVAFLSYSSESHSSICPSPQQYLLILRTQGQCLWAQEQDQSCPEWFYYVLREPWTSPS